MMSSTRIDSSEVFKRLEISLMVGNGSLLKKMKYFGQLVLDDTRQELLPKLDFFPTILLYGPPNTGKTTLVYSLFKELKGLKNNINLHYVDFSTVMTSEYGGTSKNVVAIFDDLRIKYSIDKPVILLIDELDQFCMTRDKSNEHDASRRAMSSLMLELDKLHPSIHRGIIVVAISNVQSKLDSAIIRRFNLKLSINQTLEYNEFEDYIYSISKLLSMSNMSGAEMKDLYEIYIKKGMTIPDVKGCFRDALISSQSNEQVLYASLFDAFKRGYSSVNNELEQRG